VATPLFERLRAWRATTARELGSPAYVVFADATLRGIALTTPRSRDELAGVSGVGAAKLERYVDAVLAIVRGDEPPAHGGDSAPGANLHDASPSSASPFDDIPFDDIPPEEWNL
jgi:ATP-dependent DNA helicase RecQ